MVGEVLMPQHESRHWHQTVPGVTVVLTAMSLKFKKPSLLTNILIEAVEIVKLNK